MTQSDLVRDAIENLLETEAGNDVPKTPYEAIAHLIGCSDSGGKTTLSESAGQHFGALVRENRLSKLGRFTVLP